MAYSCLMQCPGNPYTTESHSTGLPWVPIGLTFPDFITDCSTEGEAVGPFSQTYKVWNLSTNPWVFGPEAGGKNSFRKKTGLQKCVQSWMYWCNICCPILWFGINKDQIQLQLGTTVQIFVIYVMFAIFAIRNTCPNIYKSFVEIIWPHLVCLADIL